MRRHDSAATTIAWLVTASVAFLGCGARNPPAPTSKAAPSAYVFAWPFIDPSGLAPRGGTTRGGSVTLAPEPSPAWQALQAPGLSPYERDRAAILAMAGDYRTSFDFLETVVFEPPHRPAAPYRSWGTERVYVVEDRGDFISLQHVLEMVVVDDEGRQQGPFVQKHWRQDWQYQPSQLVEYRGRDWWERRALSPEERRGAWSQAVHQVDDTPRYASVGRWEHGPTYSSWTGNRTGRPLPRREHTVRDDYDLLSAVNRHTILPNGWVHEQDNLKVVTGPPARPKAREVGVDRYELIAGFDFAPADAYWRATGPFWRIVRDAWTARLGAAPALHVSTTCKGTPVFAMFFEYAARLEGDAPPSDAEMRAFVDETLDCVVTTRQR
jgi:hypothetical protein